MTFNPAKHHRHSIRLPEYDYTQPGAYFVTICVKNRDCLFGEIVNGEMRLNEYGEIVTEKWRWLAQQYPYVKLDEFIVMPNHFHGILWIRDISRRGGSRPALRNYNQPNHRDPPLRIPLPLG
jgi:putative transposase